MDGNVTITNPVSLERRPASNAYIFKQALYQMVKFSVLLCTQNPIVKMFPNVLPQSPPYQATVIANNAPHSVWWCACAPSNVVKRE